MCVCDSLPADVAGGLSGAGTATSSQRRDRDVASESSFVWNRVVLSGVEVVWIGNGSVPKIIIIKWRNKFIFFKLQSAFWWGNCFLILYGRLETLIFRVVQAIKSLPTVCCKGGGIIDNNVAGNRNILDADWRSTDWHTLCLKKNPPFIIWITLSEVNQFLLCQILRKFDSLNSHLCIWIILLKMTFLKWLHLTGKVESGQICKIFLSQFSPDLTYQNSFTSNVKWNGSCSVYVIVCETSVAYISKQRWEWSGGGVALS